ncbi:hypothetical protein DSM106972_026760 [Dulcicalothrix desertica PCC 7102]|uniref:Uncharacterized protein n=2 Tax=Dulcicalothrix desertica TaxID=32056 RepID=A0A3S1CLY3_9CYAN|nr:hypothetical protein DSM106972_026760 [Dulcicalothrix desertica PCC 7102]
MDATTAGTGEITEASINISMDTTDEQSLSKATILFDEAHNELLQWQKNSDDDEVDTWSTLASALRAEINCRADEH